MEGDGEMKLSYETLLFYVKAYFEMNSTNWNLSKHIQKNVFHSPIGS